VRSMRPVELDVNPQAGAAATRARRARGRAGFTIVEIMTVIAIILILVGMAAIAYKTLDNPTSGRSTKVALDNLQAQLADYEAQAGLRNQPANMWKRNTLVVYKPSPPKFNIWQDPDAARIVFDCGRPITLMPLDVTHQALFREADVERLEAAGTRPARVFAGLLRYFARFHRERYGWDGSPIHDAVAVGHLAIPDLVVTEAYRVDVETTSELTRGRTVVDLHGLTGKPPNADVGVRIDRDRFIDVLIDAVTSIGTADQGA